MSNDYRPILLCILDGFGIGNPKDASHDAIKQASLPCWNYLLQNFPYTELETSGKAVGLPVGQMGNSEVGHMAIGSGRIILQDLLRINKAIHNGDLAKHPQLLALIQQHLKSNKIVHLFGLASDGGVHSHLDHLIFLAKLLAKHQLKVKLHLFLDGRDTAPISASIYLNQIDSLIAEFPSIKIATIAGRFYAMDRDQRWQRTKMAYQAIMGKSEDKISNWRDYLQTQYEQNIHDEFVIPAAMNDYEGIKAGDSVIFTNFRSDRVRQLVQSILKDGPSLSYKIGMTHYSEELSLELVSLFPAQIISNNLGEIISLQNKKQLRIAETEKYAHVTFFFNGGKEDLYPGEDRILIPSPDVYTYDLQPEMSAAKVTDELIKAINDNVYDLIVVNYANGDMVGHSGKMEAAVKAVETLDKCLNKLYLEIMKTNGILIITADHGNVEYMFDEGNNVPHTSHTLNPVPFLLVANDLYWSKVKLAKGNLSDIAPTILKIMDIKQPSEMTGTSLIRENHDKKEN